MFKKNTNVIFHRTRRNNSKICTETKKTPNSQSNLEKEEWSGGIMLLDFRPYYKPSKIKIVCYWHKTTWINGTE